VSYPVPSRIYESPKVHHVRLWIVASGFDVTKVARWVVRFARLALDSPREYLDSLNCFTQWKGRIQWKPRCRSDRRSPVECRLFFQVAAPSAVGSWNPHPPWIRSAGLESLCACVKDEMCSQSNSGLFFSRKTIAAISDQDQQLLQTTVLLWQWSPAIRHSGPIFWPSLSKEFFLQGKISSKYSNV